MKRSVNYLLTRPEVIPERIGTYGHSMGSTHVWLATPFEPRIACAVGNCCLPTYAAIERARLIHCFPNFVPGWAQHGDTPDIVSLIAPRPLHLNFGELDDGSPIQEVRRGLEVISEAYRAQGAAGAFSSYVEEGAGHVLSAEMWRRTLEFFQLHLQPTTTGAERVRL